MWRKSLAFTLAALAACSEQADTVATTKPANAPALQTALASGPGKVGELTRAHQALLAASTEHALPLVDLDANAGLAQTIALTHEVLVNALSTKKPGDSNVKRHRAEVFAVYPLRESDFTDEVAGCRVSRCYRVEIFDYVRNTTLIGVADINRRAMVAWRENRGQQAEIPDRLKRIAIELATQSPDVAEALGGVVPTVEQALMPSTKTALNGTQCERSQHLCVAPTFVQGNVAVWAIVDLTEYRVAGVQWTELANARDVSSLPKPPSEQALSDALVNQRYCERNTRVQRMGWDLNYMLTASDGLRVSDARFQSKPVLNSAKLVDWHVNYSEREGFGYSDAIGCPSFSSAAVVPFAEPTITDIQDAKQETVGFRLEQEFRSLGWPLPCNYSYRQAFEFYQDGSFRPTAASIGAGCGNDGTYRPVLRIEPAGKDWQLSSANNDSFALEVTERYFEANEQTASNGARFQLRSSSLAFDVVPGRGQFANSRGDFEFVYVTANHASAAGKRDEGASDLITLGPCCNVDYRQGPELFLNDEKLQGELVFWYVPQLKNQTDPGQEYCWATSDIENGVLKARAYPCEAGPLFRVIAAQQ